MLCVKRDKDCVMCANGKCISLTDTLFQGKECPFYKTADQAAQEHAYVHDRLAKMGILELAELKYRWR